MRVWFQAGMSLFFVWSCQQQLTPTETHQNSHMDGFWSQAVNPNAKIKIVTQDGQPINKARVLIGHSMGTPFANNLVLTDENGWLEGDLSVWKSAQPITIDAPGFVRTTYFEVDPQGLRNLSLARVVKPQLQFELSGVTTGFQVKNRDGLVDFALTIPVVKPEDLFQFNLDMILSPFTDTISVLGQKVDIPSNVSLPEQRESYIFPVTLAKPTYRMGFADPGVKNLVSITGQFAIKPVFDAFRGGASFADMINQFNMLGLSVHQVTLAQAKQRQDLKVNDNLLRQARQLKAPSFNQNQDVVLGVSIGTHPNGLYPVDVKRLNSTQVLPLKVIGTKHLALGILKKLDEFKGIKHSERLSASLENWQSDGQELRFLPLLADPKLVHTHRLEVALPQVLPRQSESGSLLKLYSIKQYLGEDKKVVREDKTVLWEVYSPEWKGAIEIPRFPGDLPVGHKRWALSLFASADAGVRVLSLDNLIQGQISHVTHTNVDFQ